MSSRPSGILALRDYLLGPTLDHAAHQSPFWHQRLAGKAALVDGVAGLPLLPVTTRAQLAAAGVDLYAGTTALSDQVVLSSGTTREGRQRLLVRRSREELQAQGEYVRMLGAGVGAPDRVLHLHNVQHGLPVGDPPPGEVRVPWMPHPNMVELAFHQLCAAADAGNPFTVVRGSVSAVLTLAVAGRERGINTAALGVRCLGTNSYGVTPRVQALLEHAFGAVVLDNYSLSELPSFASRCAQCGALHWQHPPTAPELVHPTTLKAVELQPGATGMLVLTGLFPYVQRTPLIRYATGDTLAVTAWCEHRGDWGWQFLGRHKDTLVLRRGKATLPLYAEPLYHLMDGALGVARTRHPVEVLGLVKPGQLGFPKYRARDVKGALVLEVEPHNARQRARLKTFLERQLPRVFPALEKWPWRVVFCALPDRVFKP